MPISGKQSVGSVSNLFQGYWSQVQFRPGNTAAGNDYKYLGVVQEGALEISREDAEYMGTTFPRVMEVIAPSQAGMSFSGQMDELHHRNLQVSAGIAMNATSKAIADDNDPATLDDPGDYIFPGASCAFDNAFGTLKCARERCDGFKMEAVLWKALSTGSISIGGNDNVIGTPIEFTALDDSNGEYHSTLGANNGPEHFGSLAPLGYLYAPLPAAGSDVV